MQDCQDSRLLKDLRESWLAGHLYYHENLDRAVQGFVRPLVIHLVEEGTIDGFFFVRFGLGGPHLRLRLHVNQDHRERARLAMEKQADSFLQLTPSRRPIETEVIRKTNIFILANDTNEHDPTVYADNSFRTAEFHPEIERYGGLKNLPASLDLFALSSVAALEFIYNYNDAARTIQLANAAKLLFQQTLGFATVEAEFLAIIRYAVDWWGSRLPKVLAKGEVIAVSQRDTLIELLSRGAAELIKPDTAAPAQRQVNLLALGARKLSQTIESDDRDTRIRIGSSQLHMTATRLGLTNSEEVYISSILVNIFSLLTASGEIDFPMSESALKAALIPSSQSDGALVQLALSGLIR